MGTTNFDIVRANAFIGLGGLLTQGNVWHVKPSSGADGQDGKTANTAVKTLTKALSLATADQNDIVLLYAEDNSASGTSDYQSATLTWNKDLVHLIGVGAPVAVSHRARIAQLSTATGLTQLVKVSASGCLFKNLSIFHGVADATSLVALQVTGERNVFEDMHIAGVGNVTMSAAGAASLELEGGSENVFRRCVIGVDTIARDADVAEIRFDGGASRNMFEDCTVQGFISNAGYAHVKVEDATGIDRWQIFKNCLFLSESTNDATLQTAIMVIPAMSQGYILLQDSYYSCPTDATVWEEQGRTRIRNNAVAAAASGVGGEMTIL